MDARDTAGTQGTSPQNLRQWFHLVVTWNKTGDLLVYFNGTLNNTTPRNKDLRAMGGSLNSHMYVGARSHDSLNNAGSGKVDELQTM